MKTKRYVRTRPGMTLLVVILIGAIMFSLTAGLLSMISPRVVSTKSEALSEKALALADGKIDTIIDEINSFGLSYCSLPQSDGQSASDTVIAQMLSQLNGGSMSLGYSVIVNKVSKTYVDIRTNDTYSLDNGTVDRGVLTNTATGVQVTSLAAVDASYAKNGAWYEIDANSKYWADPASPDLWTVKVTAFSLSKPDTKRTILAEANRGEITTSIQSTDQTAYIANGNWYSKLTVKQQPFVPFSNYSVATYGSIQFGKFEEMTGSIRSDHNVSVGGHAIDTVMASGTVDDYAYDAGGGNSRGKFGTANHTLAQARAAGEVLEGVDPMDWSGAYTLLIGTNTARLASDTGLQDKTLAAFYFSSDITVKFTTDGKVSINNGTATPLPSNGLIFTEGNATVSGKINGRCTVAARNNIYVGGNILYTKPPHIDKSTAAPAGVPDSIGLIAKNNVMITAACYNANPVLEIDASVLAVYGWFGIDPSASWHTQYGGNPKHVGYWYGSFANYSTSRAPCMNNGWNKMQGYETQHTSYDYNLVDYSSPPEFPFAGLDPIPVDVTTYPLVTNVSLLNTLRGLTRDQLTPLDPSSVDYDATTRTYTYYYNGAYYYYGPSFGVKVTTITGDEVANYLANPNSLYRVSWKEQVADPVQ